MTSMFDHDDSINLAYNAKMAGKQLVAAKHELLSKTGEFLFLAHSDREFAMRCQFVEEDIEKIAHRKLASLSDSKAKLVRAAYDEWQIRHASCSMCQTKTAMPMVEVFPAGQTHPYESVRQLGYGSTNFQGPDRGNDGEEATRWRKSMAGLHTQAANDHTMAAEKPGVGETAEGHKRAAELHTQAAALHRVGRGVPNETLDSATQEAIEASHEAVGTKPTRQFVPSQNIDMRRTPTLAPPTL